MKNYIYPLTIVCDRYQGTYSNAQFLAFNLDYYEVPEAIGGSDPEEMIFWGSEYKEYIIGKGNTIQEAYDDLEQQLINNENDSI